MVKKLHLLLDFATALADRAPVDIPKEHNHQLVQAAFSLTDLTEQKQKDYRRLTEKE